MVNVWVALAVMSLCSQSVVNPNAIDEELPPSMDPEARIYFNNLNSTLIPLGNTGAALASTIAIVAIVIGAIFLFSFVFNPQALRGGQGLFGPWFGGYGPGNYGPGVGGYQPTQPLGGGYYNQPTQNYLYEPYSKLGYSQPTTAGIQSRSSDSMDWDSLKIIDYISVMEDMWRKLDVKDVNCQKRILCELHQNELALGPAASKIVNVFGYARYLSLLNIPEPLKNMIDDYQDAADKGRSMKDQECKEVYDSCDFSIKDTIIKKLKGH